MAFSVNETNFQQEVLESSSPVLVHFWTPWCHLCRMINPVLESFQGEQDHGFKLVSINADENFKLTNYYRLQNLPTIMLFRNGQLIQKLDNLSNRDHVKLALKKMRDNCQFLA